MPQANYYHMSVKTVARSKGHSGVAKAAYNQRTKLTESQELMDLRAERIPKREERLAQLPVDIQTKESQIASFEKEQTLSDKKQLRKFLKLKEQLKKLNKELKHETMALERDKALLEREDIVYDYSRKKDLLYSQLILPEGAPEWMQDRELLYNTVELKECRKNSVMLREFVLALPANLDQDKRNELATDLARHLSTTYNTFSDVAVHAPPKGGNEKNHHAHILMGVRALSGQEKPKWAFATKKLRVFDNSYSEGSEIITGLRERWAEMLNTALEAAGSDERVDHRSLKEQGISQRLPQVHLGKAASMERRAENPQRTSRGDQLAYVAEKNKALTIQAAFSKQETKLAVDPQEQAQALAQQEALKRKEERQKVFLKQKESLKHER